MEIASAGEMLDQRAFLDVSCRGTSKEITLISFLKDSCGSEGVPLNVERIMSLGPLKERLIKSTYGDLFHTFTRIS